MHSDNGPPGADGQPLYTESQPMPPPGQRPSWLIWTIVGGAAALVAIVGSIGIVAVARRGGTPEGTAPEAPNPASVAVENLRAHLPAELKFAAECTEDSPQPLATATVTCTWPGEHVPRAASYSLFDDNNSMLKTATDTAGGSDYGSACLAAGDFENDGGQMLWRRDNRDRGTVWCYHNADDKPQIVWTDTTPKILATAVAPAKKHAGALLEWFVKSGQASLEAIPAPKKPPQPTTKSPPKPEPTAKGPTTKGPTTNGPTTKGPNTNEPNTNSPPNQERNQSPRSVPSNPPPSVPAPTQDLPPATTGGPPDTPNVQPS